MTLSSRHHFIPEFFIKGFIGIDNKLWVFDKELGKVQKLKKSPKQIFFEWNRNTFDINGFKTDFVEKLYQFSESKFAETHKKLIEEGVSVDISYYEMFHLIYFVSSLYWRLPSRDNEVVDISEFLKLSFKNIENKISDRATLEKQLLEIQQHPAYVSSSKLVKSITDYMSSKSSRELTNWKIYFSTQKNQQIQLLSDNPIILRTKEENFLNSEMVLSLSKGKTLYYSKGEIKKAISPTNIINVDTLSFIQADRYVCGVDASYLEGISFFSKKFDSEEKVKRLKNQVFEIFN